MNSALRYMTVASVNRSKYGSRFIKWPWYICFEPSCAMSSTGSGTLTFQDIVSKGVPMDYLTLTTISVCQLCYVMLWTDFSDIAAILWCATWSIRGSSHPYHPACWMDGCRLPLLSVSAFIHQAALWPIFKQHSFNHCSQCALCLYV